MPYHLATVTPATLPTLRTGRSETGGVLTRAG
jgi:hypothetical protein